jgi:hypothetical protein
MKILDPLVECKRKRTVRGKGAPNAGLRHYTDASQTQARNQAARDELAPVDAPLCQFAAVRLSQQVFLFAQSAHLFPQWFTSFGASLNCSMATRGSELLPERQDLSLSTQKRRGVKNPPRWGFDGGQCYLNGQ